MDTQAIAARLTAQRWCEHCQDWRYTANDCGRDGCPSPPADTQQQSDLNWVRAQRDTAEEKLRECRAHVETLTQQVAFDTSQLKTQAGALNEQAVRVRNLQQENARLTADGQTTADKLQAVGQLLVHVKQQRDAAHAALKNLRAEVAGMIGYAERDLRYVLGSTNLGVLKLRVSEADAALAASAPQKEGK